MRFKRRLDFKNFKVTSFSDSNSHLFTLLVLSHLHPHVCPHVVWEAGSSTHLKLDQFPQYSQTSTLHPDRKRGSQLLGFHSRECRQVKHQYDDLLYTPQKLRYNNLAWSSFLNRCVVFWFRIHIIAHTHIYIYIYIIYIYIWYVWLRARRFMRSPMVERWLDHHLVRSPYHPESHLLRDLA